MPKLESPPPTLIYPCDIDVKVMGRADTDNFVAEMLAIVQQHFPTVMQENCRTRHSKENKYLSLTVSVHAESREQIDGLYQQLTQHPLVLMAL